MSADCGEVAQKTRGVQQLRSLSNSNRYAESHAYLRCLCNLRHAHFLLREKQWGVFLETWETRILKRQKLQVTRGIPFRF